MVPLRARPDRETFVPPYSFQNGVDMFGQPKELPISGFVPSGLRRNFDQTPDGKQFVMMFRSAPTVTVIPKWNGTD